MEEKYDSEEKFDPGAETEAGKEAVADLDPKNEQEKYLLKFRKIQAKSVKWWNGHGVGSRFSIKKKIIYWFIHKFVNNAFDPEGVGNGLTSRTTSINPTISSAGATKVSLIPDTLLLPLDLDEPGSEGSDRLIFM